MGTCSILVNENLLNALQNRNDCKVLSSTDFGEGLFQILLEHDSLSGYMGQYCAIIEDGVLSLKRDLDV